MILLVMMKRIIIALLFAVTALPLAVLLMLVAGFAGGACHCFTLTTILFPYGTILLDNTSLQLIGEVLVIAQFPIYAFILAIVRRTRPRLLISLGLLAIHIAAALVGLKVNR